MQGLAVTSSSCGANCDLLPALGQLNDLRTLASSSCKALDKRQLISAVHGAHAGMTCLCRGTSRLGACCSTQAQGVGQEAAVPSSGGGP